MDAGPCGGLPMPRRRMMVGRIYLVDRFEDARRKTGDGAREDRGDVLEGVVIAHAANGALPRPSSPALPTRVGAEGTEL